MALSKLSLGASLCRALFRSSDAGRIFRTCALDGFHQPAYASKYTQVQTISTSFCFHDRHFVKKSSAIYPRLKGSVCKSSTGKSEPSHTKTESNKVVKSNSVKKSEKTTTAATNGDKPKEKLGILQRFKEAYKQHGKILIGVHLATSSVWFGSFWYLVHNGVDVVSFLERLGISDRILSPIKNSGAGDIAVAYLLYKLATPARYTVTLAGTNYMIKYLRKVGRMEPQKEKMRDLMRDSRKAMRPKLSQTQLHRLQHKLKSVQSRSKSRVQKLRGRSQRRLVQLRRFIRSKSKKKS